MLERYDAFEHAFRNQGRVNYKAKAKDKKTGEESQVNSSADFNFKEFIGTKDAYWMFPKVVQSVMLEAAEPDYLVTPLLNVVRVSESTKIVEYNAVGALRAYIVPEGQEYPTDDFAWASGTRTAKVSKKGLRIPITDEMLADAAYDLVAMYLRAAAKAMARLKEQIALERFLEAGTTVKDNDDAAAYDGKRMLGVGPDGNGNGSIDMQDWLDVFGQMIAAGYTPSHIIMHPLAWSMFAQDPIVRNLGWYSAGPGLRGDNVMSGEGKVNANRTMAAFLQRTAPMGLQVITTPFVKYDATNNVTDMLVIDSNTIGALTVREDMTTEQFDDPTRDIISLKVKERYDVTVFPTDGMNICRLGNVKVERNYGREVQFSQDLAGGDFGVYAGGAFA